MAYSELEQHNRDIDWFFTDHSNKVFHVASAGGQLPSLISENDRTNKMFIRQINRLEPNFDFEINENVFGIINYENEELNTRNLYLESFIFYAKRGIYSFDKSILNLFEDNTYHLVAFPISGYLTNAQLSTRLKLPQITEEIDITKLDKFNLFDYFK